ncbi:hypothetical protein [Falsiroseomonas sp.]|uniref:hypothetical protein n=1 Tax=Falsiroseomonas sp. TaxID=2870721 RepID=UPI003569E8CD
MANTARLASVARLSLLLLGGTALAAMPVSGPWTGDQQVAFAKDGGGGGGGGNGGGQGNGGENGGGHAGDQGNGQGNGHGHGATADGTPGNGRGNAFGRGDDARGHAFGRGGVDDDAGRAANRGALSSALGGLNAARASATAQANAAPNSRVGMIAAYEQAMLAALSLPATTPVEIGLRDQAIAQARAVELEAAANRPVTPAVVDRVDAMLGLPPTDSTLGVTR